MRATYRVLAFAIAALVAVQSAAIGYAVFSHWLAALGAVHGAVAVVLFGAAVMAAMRARTPAVVQEPVAAEVA